MRLLAAAALIAAPAGLALGTAPAGAAAPTEAGAVADDGGHAITYTAGSAQENRVVITEAKGTEFTIDDVVPIKAGTDCVHPDASDQTKVVCTLTEFGDYWVRIRVELGDGDDTLSMHAGSENSLHGGSGNDEITGGGNNFIFGEDGDDTLAGGTQDGGNGADLLSAPDYGAVGGAGNDTLVGTDGPDDLRGGADHDMIIGRAGDDTLYGNSGNDTIHGGGGNDFISGGTGKNTIYQ
ncbi:hemolysin-type calcium-binding protein [Streptomyces albus]|uniref:Hemolysin-type calcium-binding protein n=1 Tax=Streptomyces albus (strain ATCC 21838 / DSM 41398 / FERM P-419 / JCM 4703 / NBRC 107858) TaxID=1081613 RepID=A0A0B5ENU1_STRA4|nr:hemolysin-type calcium-binding protein [Streptomyces albus]AYN34372.1 hemolysin-type calcium-binding protein [Streptomyces albus]